MCESDVEHGESTHRPTLEELEKEFQDWAITKAVSGLWYAKRAQAPGVESSGLMPPWLQPSTDDDHARRPHLGDRGDQGDAAWFAFVPPVQPALPPVEQVAQRGPPSVFLLFPDDDRGHHVQAIGDPQRFVDVST